MGQYNAFISYSHAADGRLAPAVQAALERLAKPWYRRRALRIFRDNTGLSVNPALWSSIKVAMDESEYFLLFASPEAAESEWVNKELTHWKAEKPVDHILPIVSDGTWVWDNEAHDFDWERSTAVPAALGGVFAEEPRHLDLSWARSETHLNRRHARFRDAIAQLGAPIHGRTKDELEGEDIRQHKRTIRLAWGAAVTLTVLAVAAIVGASLAVANANRAEQRRIASRSRELAARAENFQDRDLDLAVLLAAEGFRLDETAEARTALLTGLQRSPGLERIIHWPNANVSEVAFSPDGRTLATAASESTAGGIVWLSDLETGTDINGALSGIKRSATSAAWAPDGTTLATGADSGQVLIWDLANEGPRADANAGAPVNAVAYSADSRLVISGATDGTVEFWNVEDGTPLTNPIDAHSEEITSAATGPGSLAVTGSLDGTIRLWDLDTLAPTGPPIKARDTTVNSVAVSPDGATIAVGGSEGTIELWATRAGTLGRRRTPLAHGTRKCRRQPCLPPQRQGSRLRKLGSLCATLGSRRGVSDRRTARRPRRPRAECCVQSRRQDTGELE